MTQANSADLWCIHILGPDDVLAAPSKEEAERAAKWLTQFWKEQHDNHSEYEPLKIAFVAEPWPWSAEAHAKDVINFYRDSGLPEQQT